MSENAFFLVPSDPFFVPTEKQQLAALAFFREVSPSFESEYIFLNEHVQLHDSGEYWYAVICAKCGKRLEFSSYPGTAKYEDWWHGVLNNEINQWSQGERVNLENVHLTMPCCNQRVCLFDLKFDWPCAFGKFALGQLEPWYTDYWEGDERDYGIGTLLKKSTLQQFEEKLGCPLIQVWQRR